MKVLVFTSLYPNNVWPHHGVFVKERMATFAKQTGCPVKVVAPVPYYPSIKFGLRRAYSQIAHQETRDGLEVYHPRFFMTPKVGMSTYGVLLFLSVLPLVRRIQRSFDFDLIDAHFVYPEGLAAVLLGRYFGKPVVISARGTDINLYRSFPIIRRMLQYSLRKADRVVAVCQALKDAMVELGIAGEKIAVIPNGVDAGKFFPFPKENARQKLGLPHRKIILSVGGLVPRKGFHVLIKALSLLVNEEGRKDLYLVIAGEGPFRRELEQLVSSLGLKEHVRMAGDVAHENLYLWYNAADLFCLASDREGWPNVLLESLACGTPVVATSVWGIPDVISSEEYGLLTERDEKKMAATIMRALRTSWNTEAIVAYARRHAWAYVADSVLQTFQSARGELPPAERGPAGY